MIYRTLILSLMFVSLVTGAEREPWTASQVVGSPDPPKPYHVQRVYPKLKFKNPVELMPLADTGRMIVLEVGGKLFTFEDDPACKEADLAIDVQSHISPFRRAFGFCVHPDFDTNRQIFVAYAGNPVARPEGTRLSRFVMSDDFTIDPASEEVLLTWHSGGHNGCAIRFDSKGLLYFSAGDGARPFPPDEYDTSQDLSDLRATICRIDVDHPEGDRLYSIPKDNPFVDTPDARGEIYAYGFRNPWRFTIAPDTDQILCGDVGWELWELVFDVRRGGNYGWSLFEGPQPIRNDITPGPTPIRKPLVAYPHAVGQSVTGGVVYRGKDHPELRGAYLYGDYVTGLLWGMRHDEEQVTWNPVISETGLAIISFAESRKKEVLVLGYDGGIYQLVKNEAIDQPSEFPRMLSKTGLFESTETMQPSPGVLSYSVMAQSWQDGAKSNFVLGMPGTDPIKVNQRQRSWGYPTGTVFAKTISKHSRRLETQMLHFDGIDWKHYSYLWNDSQTDADLVDTEGVSKTFPIENGEASELTWSVQNRSQCKSCHSRQHGGAAGFSFANLGTEQVNRFVQSGVLDRAAPKWWNVSNMVDPGDLSADLEARARSYLKANCAHCHQRGGGGTVALDLTYSNPIDQINAVNVAPTQGAFGIKVAKVIAPGDPYHSVLFYRMATSGMGHMPKVWTRQNDLAGLQLVHDWILAMGTEDSQASKKTDDAFENTSESLRMFAEVSFDESKVDERLPAAKLAQESGSFVTAALFERYLPVNERRKRLGDKIDPDHILSMQGDALRGRQQFLDGQAQQCILCHRLQGSGRSVGPDLDGIAGKRTRKQLLQSILDPSLEIDPKFGNHLVLSDDGTILSGLKISETSDHVGIRSADGKNHQIEKDAIESIRIQTQSLMPAGLAAEMTADELADLLAFLLSLK